MKWRSAVKENSLCMGQLLLVPLELIYDCSWILGLREEKGKEVLPYEGGVYFCTPTVFSCLDSWCLLCSEHCDRADGGFCGREHTGLCVCAAVCRSTEGQQLTWVGCPDEPNQSSEPGQLQVLPDRTKQGNPLGGERLPGKPWMLWAALRGGWRCY